MIWIVTDGGGMAKGSYSTDYPEFEGIEQQVIDDWVMARKAKKLPINRTVIDRLVKEFGKAGLSFADGIKECAGNAWGGFRASWGRDAVAANRLTVVTPTRPRECPLPAKVTQTPEVVRQGIQIAKDKLRGVK